MHYVFKYAFEFYQTNKFKQEAVSNFKKLKKQILFDNITIKKS